MSADRQRKIEAGVRKGWKVIRAAGPLADDPDSQQNILRAFAEEEVPDATADEVRSALQAMTEELERKNSIFEAADKFRDRRRPSETIREAIMRAAAEGNLEAKALLADNSLDIIEE